MVVSMKLAATVIGGLMFATVAWAGPAGNAASVSSPGDPSSIDAASAHHGVDRSLIGVLSPLVSDTAPHEAQKRCTPDDLYSQHDVNGDPDACFRNRVNVPIL